MSRTPQMTIEEQRALFVSRSAAFALTPEEQLLANIPIQPRVETTNPKVSEDDKPSDNKKRATVIKGMNFKFVSVLEKPKQRTDRLVSLLDEKVRIDRMKREGNIDEVKKMEATLRKAYSGSLRSAPEIGSPAEENLEEVEEPEEYEYEESSDYV
jgi:hypothetical protein